MTKLTDMLDRFRSKGSLGVKVGIIKTATYPDGMKVSTVGYINEYGRYSRPFFRSAIAKNRDVLPQMIASLLKENDPEVVLRLVGEHMSDELKESVMTWADPGNAQSTIDAKGYDAPLRANDKLLRNSFSYEVDQ